MPRRDRPTTVLTVVIVALATSPLWLWGLDNLLHFGFTGDHR